jgi:molecular chaperone DnaK
LPEEQKEMVKKQVEELKTLLKDEKWDELKEKVDNFEHLANTFANQQGKPEPEGNE